MQMLSGRAGRVFGTLAAAHLVNDSYVYFLPTLLPLLVPSLGITLTMAGLAVGLYQVTSSLAQPLLGHLADRYPLRWLAWLGLAATAIGAAGIGVAPHLLGAPAPARRRGARDVSVPPGRHRHHQRHLGRPARTDDVP